MPDPFDALRAPVTPVDPDPVFASRLRARIERALELPRGVAVSTSVVEPTVVQQLGAAIPRLTVSNGRSAIDWYVRVFDAALVGRPYWLPDGNLAHAELTIGGGSIEVADEYPPVILAPNPDLSSVGLVLIVSDVDAVVARAFDAGGRLSGEVQERYGHRTATIYDPFGHRWVLRTPVPLIPLQHGDIGYVSVWVPDIERAAEFYSAVLGWEYGPIRHPRGRQVVGAGMHIGMYGEQDRGTLFCCYAVEDVPAAVEAVRAAGGTANEPVREPYGLLAECVDNQGVQFAVYEPEPGDHRPTYSRPGDLAYFTFEVVDSAAARAFYGSVLGWEFRSGSIADGWQVPDVVPMTGLSGGHEKVTGVPMWLVEDIGSAVDRVRAAGGRATDPERQPYGITADCIDDQGTHFYLGQL
jgi:predicted enzyme related to lactoylglutathione lyase